MINIHLHKYIVEKYQIFRFFTNKSFIMANAFVFELATAATTRPVATIVPATSPIFSATFKMLSAIFPTLSANFSMAADERSVAADSCSFFVSRYLKIFDSLSVSYNAVKY